MKHEMTSFSKRDKKESLMNNNLWPNTSCRVRALRLWYRCPRSCQAESSNSRVSLSRRRCREHSRQCWTNCPENIGMCKLRTNCHIIIIQFYKNPKLSLHKTRRSILDAVCLMKIELLRVLRELIVGIGTLFLFPLGNSDSLLSFFLIMLDYPRLLLLLSTWSMGRGDHPRKLWDGNVQAAMWWCWSGASCTQIKPNWILFHICEWLLISWGSCRVLSQLNKGTAVSAALNGTETEPNLGCHLTFRSRKVHVVWF